MEFTEKQFGFYFSLSSPHLGYLNGVNMLVKAGMWLMRTVNKTTSLEQLAMEESGHHKDTFLFKLSKTGNLKKFQKIILLSCPEDGYVSWHSARIAPHRSRNNDSRVEEEMCRNIIGDKIVHRIDVHW